MSITQKRTPFWPSLFARVSVHKHKEQQKEEQRVSQLLEVFTNIMMKNGKKTKARSLIAHAFAVICWKTGLPVHHVLHSLRDQMTPLFGLRSLRVGGSSLQVPFLLPRHTADAQGFRWLLQGAQRRRGKLRVSRSPSLFFQKGNTQHASQTKTTPLRSQQRIAGFSECLIAEIEETLLGQGFAIAQRKERHKRALANRQYAHYARW